jgi:hypothetical protein
MVSVETLSFFAASLAESQTVTAIRFAGRVASEVLFMPFLFGGDPPNPKQRGWNVEADGLSARNNAKL